MDAFFHVWVVLIEHGHAAIVEFVLDMGDHVVTHLIAIVVIKLGIVHVGWTVIKRVRKRNVRVTPVKPVVKTVKPVVKTVKPVVKTVKPVVKHPHPHRKAGHKT
jgi:hypothetical protein